MTEAETNENGQVFCVVCGTTRGLRVHDGLAACRSHFDEVFFQCSSCGQYFDTETAVIWKRDVTHHATSERVLYCRHCSEILSRSSLNSHWLQSDWEAMETSHAVGIEIECINSTGKTISRIFQEHAEQMRLFCQHTDASVTGGLELVSSPIRMREFVKFIRKCRWMERTFRVDTSCGLHVHFNMRPWIVFEEADLEELGQVLQKLVLGLLRIEEFMFKTQPRSRRPHGAHYSYTQKIRSTIRGLRDMSYREIEQMTGEQFAQLYFRDAVYHNIRSIEDIPRGKLSIRYCWANLSAITMYNTIEFRLHSGTTSAKKIELWVRCLDKIMTHILDSTLEELRNFGPDKLPEILDEDEMAYLNERIEKFRGE